MFGLKRKNIMSVRTYGDPSLKKSSLPVMNIDHDIVLLAEALINTMFADDGIGLAAPQVGVNLRMAALGVPMGKNGDGKLAANSPGEMELLPQMPMILLNPEIIASSDAKEEREEGCLSLPDIYAPVIRPVSVVLKAQVFKGPNIQFECSGLLARAVQHEIDHLDGILFIDRITEEERKKIQPRLDRLKKHGKRKGFLKGFSK